MPNHKDGILKSVTSLQTKRRRNDINYNESGISKLSTKPHARPKFSPSSNRSTTTETSTSRHTDSFRPKYIFDRNLKPKVLYFRKPTSNAPYYHPHLTHDLVLTRLFAEAYHKSTYPGAHKMSSITSRKHRSVSTLPDIMTSHSTLPPSKKENSVMDRTLSYLYKEQTTLKKRARENWNMRLREVDRKKDLQKRKTVAQKKLNRRQRMPQLTREKEEEWNRIKRDIKQQPRQPEPERLPSIQSESKATTASNQVLQGISEPSVGAFTKLPNIPSQQSNEELETSYRLIERISLDSLKSDEERQKSRSSRATSNPVVNATSRTTSRTNPHLEQKHNISQKPPVAREIEFCHSMSNPHLKHDAQYRIRAKSLAGRNVEEGLGSGQEKVSGSAKPFSSYVEELLISMQPSVTSSLHRRKTSSPDFYSETRIEPDTAISPQNVTTSQSHSTKKSPTSTAADTLIDNRPSSSFLDRMKTARRLAETFRKVQLARMVYQIYLQNKQKKESKGRKEIEEKAERGRAVRRLITRRRIKELEHTMFEYTQQAIRHRREEKERLAAARRILDGRDAYDNTPPWEFLDCGYLRFDKQLVEDLENMAERAGCPVGIHRQMTNADVDAYLLKTTEQARKSRIRERWWRVIRLVNEQSRADSDPYSPDQIGVD